MDLSPPLIISSRLLPAIVIDGTTISIKNTGKRTPDNRQIWRWYVDLAGGRTVTKADLITGCGANPTPQEMMCTLLAFMGACAESTSPRYEKSGENADLFPKRVREWCYPHEDEIANIREEIESSLPK